jgi:hypothetical protein
VCHYVLSYGRLGKLVPGVCCVTDGPPQNVCCCSGLPRLYAVDCVNVRQAVFGWVAHETQKRRGLVLRVRGRESEELSEAWIEAEGQRLLC